MRCVGRRGQAHLRRVRPFGVGPKARHLSDPALDQTTSIPPPGWACTTAYGVWLAAWHSHGLHLPQGCERSQNARVPLQVEAALVANIRRRLTPQPVKMRADVEVTCFAYEGVDAVREALCIAQQVGAAITARLTPSCRQTLSATARMVSLQRGRVACAGSRASLRRDELHASQSCLFDTHGVWARPGPWPVSFSAVQCRLGLGGL